MSEQSDSAKLSAEADAKVETKAEAATETTCDVLAAFDAEAAALPVVESPGISPEAPAAEPVVAAEKPAEKSVEAAAPAEPTPDVATIESPPLSPASATQRFRAAAASQIAAARERISERNTSPVIAVALIAGLAGAAGQAGMSALTQPDRTVWQSRALEDAIAKLDDSISSLRSNIERTAELAASQSASTTERLAQIEKAQAEPTAQIIKLSEAVEKLRETNSAFASRFVSRFAARDASDITGSIKPGLTGNKSPAKAAIVEGWTLKDLDQDVALLEGRHGLFETAIGEIIPGVGRVEGFRKQDGRWVVVTARGLIVSR